MGEIVEQHFILHTPSGAPLRGDVRWDKELAVSVQKKLPVVIVSHGFKAFKDWGPFPAIGRYFADRGFLSIVFNFSHNGIGEHPKKFVEHEKFANNTISLEIDDLKTILDEITFSSFGLPFVDRKKIFLIGHSRGGGVSLITAKEDRRVSAVVAWSTIAYFGRYSEEQKQRWREKDYIQLHTNSDSQFFHLKTTLLDDLEKNAQRLNIINAVEHLQKPLLIIHGTGDIPVKIEEVEKLYEASDKHLTEFVILEGVGHMYGAKHPYKEHSPTLIHILDITSQWLHKYSNAED